MQPGPSSSSPARYWTRGDSDLAIVARSAVRSVLLLCVLVLASACASEAPPMSAEQVAVFKQEVDVELVVTAAQNAMRFETTRIEAPEGATVRLVMDNETSTSPAMLHNVVVLATGADIEAIGRAAVGTDGYVPDDPDVLVATPLARPRGKTAVVFTMPPAGEYPYVCTYPGHYVLMRGVLVSTPQGA